MSNLIENIEMAVAEETRDFDSLIKVFEQKARAGNKEALETMRMLIKGKQKAIEYWEKFKLDLIERVYEVIDHPELLQLRQIEACKQAVELCEKLKAQRKKIEGGENYGI